MPKGSAVLASVSGTVMVVDHIVRNRRLDRLAAEERKRKKAHEWGAHRASQPPSCSDVLLTFPLKSSGEMRQSVGDVRQSVGELKMQFAAQAAKSDAQFAAQAAKSDVQFAAQAAKSDAQLYAIVVLGLSGMGLQLARRW